MKEERLTLEKLALESLLGLIFNYLINSLDKSKDSSSTTDEASQLFYKLLHSVIHNIYIELNLSREITRRKKVTVSPCMPVYPQTSKSQFFFVNLISSLISLNQKNNVSTIKQLTLQNLIG